MFRRLKKIWIILFFCFPLFSIAGNDILFRVQQGIVSFSSEAPLELIQAESDKLTGILDISKGQFAFKVPIASFSGFNNPLQREHFNENYMETEAYPDATFTGKIIEDISYAKKAVFSVRAKGKFTLHGITQERIIPAEISITRNKIIIRSAFRILLSDYNIKIPRIVTSNLSKEIKVTVSTELATQ